jgi:hypothetical protein
MAEPKRVPTRRQAIALLERGDVEVRALIAHLPRHALTRPGLGGGEWSPKDLISHLATWEEFAICALDAWAEGHGPAFEKELWSKGTAAVNRAAHAGKAGLSAPEAFRRAEVTHRDLIVRIETLTDAQWRRPATPRARKPMGERLGGFLGGPRGAFRHADAHLDDLRTLVADATR